MMNSQTFSRTVCSTRYSAYLREPRPTVEVGDADQGVPGAVRYGSVVLCERRDERARRPLAQQRDERVHD